MNATNGAARKMAQQDGAAARGVRTMHSDRAAARVGDERTAAQAERQSDGAAAWGDQRLRRGSAGIRLSQYGRHVGRLRVGVCVRPASERHHLVLRSRLVPQTQWPRPPPSVLRVPCPAKGLKEGAVQRYASQRLYVRDWESPRFASCLLNLIESRNAGGSVAEYALVPRGGATARLAAG